MPISIAANSRDISVMVSSGDGGISDHVYIIVSLVLFILYIGQPPSCEGVSVTKLPNGDAQVT